VADINTGPKAQGTYRAALAAVIILSVLMALAIIGLAAGFVHQYRLYQQDQAPAALSRGDLPSVTLRLAPGTHIISASTDAGKLVLHVQTAKGAEVLVLDLATGAPVTQVIESK
jgi:hypothetical protein